MEKCKHLYDEEVEKNYGKTKYDCKRKSHVAVRPRLFFYFFKAVRELHAVMKDASNDDSDFQPAIKVATHVRLKL